MTIVDALTQALPADALITDPAILEGAQSDASGTGAVRPVALVRPSSLEEVSTALKICNAHGQAVVPQGGMSGLAGGANPRAGDVALSMARFSGIEQIDPVAETMTVRAGTVLQEAQQAAREAGFALPVDLGARGSCQIGGIIATNAGGVSVIRDGMTRDNLRGLEVVLADGTVLSNLGKVTKNNTGYDLRHLFAGTEGTLGVITRAVFRLRRLVGPQRTALCAIDTYEDVIAFLAHARATLPGLAAFEAMWRDHFAFNQEKGGISLFADSPAYTVLIEAETAAGEDGFDRMLEAAWEKGLVRDALVAQSETEARRFWSVREGEAMSQGLPGLLSFDVSMPIGDMDAFATRCKATLGQAFPAVHVLAFGHIGDGNLHVCAGFEDGIADSITDRAEGIEETFYDLVRQFGGSISAEHGIGTLKRPWLGYSRSEAELATMRAIKSALDPNGILNPGKVL